MKKSILMLLALVGLSLCVATVVYAAESYPASAIVPSPIDVDPFMIEVMGDGKSPTDWPDPPVENFSMNFGQLEPSVSGKFITFLSDHFYSIDVGYVYGPSTAKINQVTVDYNEVSAPQAHGLGWKTTATFVKKFMLPDGSEKGEAIPDDLIGLGKVRLIDLDGGEGILLTDISPGWLRIYVGLVTKDPNDDVFGANWPENFEVFSPGDETGEYTGTLIISST